MHSISPIVGLMTRRGCIFYVRMESSSVLLAVRGAMSDEDFILTKGQGGLAAGDDDVEEMLEILVKIANAEGREFLAYLLGMALMEARNKAPAQTHLSH